MSSPGVTITAGPSDWQIIQRNREGLGEIAVSGTFVTNAADFTIQVRVVDENMNTSVLPRLDWQDAETDTAAGTFSIRLLVPAGGLYRIETRVRRLSGPDKRPMRGDCIHHIGVGDIYVIAGQSNASGTGKGASADGPALGVHLFANDESWKLATHPLEDATDTLHPITITSVFHGHSPWLAFGKRLLTRTGIPVGLIPTALGGSRIEQWVREDGGYGSLLLNMEEMIRKAGGEIAGILWYQGESDALGPATEDRIGRYPQRFHTLLEAFRTIAVKSGAELPVFTAQLGAYTAPDAPDPQWSRMREIQRGIAHEEQVELIVTLDCPLSDEIHISSAGNVLVGERFADAALERIHGTPTAYRYPEPVRITVEGEAKDALLLRFANVHGDWTAARHPADITVQDAAGSVPIERYEWPGGTDILLRLGRSLSGEVTVYGLYGAAPRPTLFDDDGRCLTPFSWIVGAVSGQSV